MTTQVQVRGNVQATQEARTLASRELDVNTTDGRICIHDGSTVGGIPHVNYKDQQNQEYVYASASGTNSITMSCAIAPAAYAAGQRFVFKAANTNTGSATLNVNSLGAKTLKKKDVANSAISTLDAGDIIQGGIYTAFYDGTDMVLESVDSGGGVAVVASETITGSPTSVTFSDVFTLGYSYEIEFQNVEADGNAKLYFEFGTSGTSWITSGYDFTTFGVDNAGSLIVESSTSATIFVLSTAQIQANEKFNGKFFIQDPMNTSTYSAIQGTLSFRENGTSAIIPATIGGEQRSAAQATASVRIRLEGSNTFGGGAITIREYPI